MKPRHTSNFFQAGNVVRLPAVFLLAYALIGLTATQAANYYVATTGSNTNDGASTNTPFLTIACGVGKLDPGDTLYVRGGTYVETVNVTCSGTATNPITITAYPGELPIIDGQGTLPGRNWGRLLQLRGDNIKASGFEIRNANTNGNHRGGNGIYIVGAHNTVGKMNVHHCWEAGILASGDYSIVEDCLVWQNAQHNNRVTHPSSGWATGLSAARDRVNGITDHAILRRNTVFNNWGEGLSTFEAEGTIMEDNVVYDNWAVNIYISDAANVLCQRNLVYTTSNNAVGGKAGGIWLADELAGKPRSTNNVVINNFVYGGGFDAFSWTLVPGSGLDNVVIANNTLVNCPFRIGAYAGSGILNTNSIIANNIFFADSGNPWKLNSIFTGLSFSNNLWSATPPADISGGATDVIGNPMLWRTGSMSPGLLSPDYFRLLTNSPAIKNGAVLAAVTSDFFGIARGTPPCIGGDEMSRHESTDQ